MLTKYLAALSLLALVGCTAAKYEYVAPQDPENLKCVRHCMDKKWSCSQECNAQHSRCMLGNVPTNIINTLKNRDDAKLQQQQTCDSNKHYCLERCESLYNDCYRTCGGTVKVYEIK